MQEMNCKVDRQVTSLLDITFWSNIVVIVLLIAINAVNFQRAATGGETLVKIASPELIAIISGILAIWMGVSCFTAMRVKARLKNVFIRLSETGVSGVSMPEPMNNKKGTAFEVAYKDITGIRAAETHVTTKSTISSLRIICGEREYDVPAPEHLQELMELLADRIGK
jgi:hypothetical protein